MKKILVILTLLISVFAKAENSTASYKLAKFVVADDTLKASILQSYQRNLDKDKLAKFLKHRAEVSTIIHREIVEPLNTIAAKHISENLNSSEITQAFKYYESNVGRKYKQFASISSKVRPSASKYFDPKELKEVEKFESSE